MQTIIMTVGTSLLTNRDERLPVEKRRPWAGKGEVGDVETALAWMRNTDLELISAETNTVHRFDLRPNDKIILLYSDTREGAHSAEILKLFFHRELGQRFVDLVKVPGVNYESDERGSVLEKMAQLLKDLIEGATGHVTLAATGGFKAEVMVMAIVGNNLGVPVCYIHEQYKSLVYLPYLEPPFGKPIRPASQPADLPTSGTPRDQVVQLSKVEHHRPRSWPKVEKMLQGLPWVDRVRYDEKAFGAPRNSVKRAPRGTDDGRHVLWLRLEDEQGSIAVSIETTGYTPEHLEQATAELRERLGRLLY